ncbi:hypothetical protein J2S69_001733 [Glycomyces lechevalierae]|uniref:Uncharacterized protein n=1 Tax=Glycomyces lechevalierae TaxID=256034 RepID=A0ABU2ALD9_9ACTN|nr:hypothetical protein [Glycomyces lechevalierae]
MLWLVRGHLTCGLQNRGLQVPVLSLLQIEKGPDLMVRAYCLVL